MNSSQVDEELNASVLQSQSLPFDPPDPVRFTTQLEISRDKWYRYNQYIRGPRIGKGKHGEVYLCDDGHVDARQVALKIVKRNHPRDRIKLLRRNYQQQNETTGSASSASKVPPLSSTENSIRKEISIMKKCRHANLVHLLEVIDDPSQDKIFIAMEYLSGGPVEWSTPDGKPMLTLRQSRRIIRDVINGIEYLHFHGIIHRDIKPANLLYTRNHGTTKIIDFGVSHFMVANTSKSQTSSQASDDRSEDSILFPESDLLKTIGTPSFLAPEVVWFSDEVKSQSSTSRVSVLLSSFPGIRSSGSSSSSSLPSQRPPVTKAIDIWSLAVTFYCFLFGHTPFNVPSSSNENAHEFTLYNKICTQDWLVDETMGADEVPTGGRHPNDQSSEGFAIINILGKMLQKDPKKRINIGELKKQDWILKDVADPRDWLRRTSPKGAEVSWMKSMGNKVTGLLPNQR